MWKCIRCFCSFLVPKRQPTANLSSGLHSTVKAENAFLCTVHQQTVHLHCYGLAPENPAKDYWWGLEFYNASRSLSVDGIIVVNESSSILQNVDVMYAGVDPRHSPVPAIRASPSVPSMVNVTIQNVALDGTNFTEVRSSTVVYNCTVSNCRGKCGAALC